MLGNLLSGSCTLYQYPMSQICYVHVMMKKLRIEDEAIKLVRGQAETLAQVKFNVKMHTLNHYVYIIFSVYHYNISCH